MYKCAKTLTFYRQKKTVIFSKENQVAAFLGAEKTVNLNQSSPFPPVLWLAVTATFKAFPRRRSGNLEQWGKTFPDTVPALTPSQKLVLNNLPFRCYFLSFSPWAPTASHVSACPHQRLQLPPLQPPTSHRPCSTAASPPSSHRL